MTNEEFNNEFDIYYNNIASNQSPGLDEYEKSVILTKAQEEVVLSLYGGKSNLNISFDNTEEAKRYLSNLVRTCVLNPRESMWCSGKLSCDSYNFVLPNDIWFIVYESAHLEDDSLLGQSSNAIVVPVSQDDYYRTINSPYRGPNHRRVLRLDVKDNSVELVSKYNIKNYTVRYLSRPDPIILIDLPEGLSINGREASSECRLNSALHRKILEVAVEIAKRVYSTQIVK